MSWNFELLMVFCFQWVHQGTVKFLTKGRLYVFDWCLWMVPKVELSGYLHREMLYLCLFWRLVPDRQQKLRIVYSCTYGRSLILDLGIRSIVHFLPLGGPRSLAGTRRICLRCLNERAGRGDLNNRSHRPLLP